MTWIEWLGRNSWWLQTVEFFVVLALAIGPLYYYLHRLNELYFRTTDALRDRIRQLELDHEECVPRREMMRR